MLNEAEADQVKYWNETTDSQLTSTYATLGDTSDLPSRDSVMHATRYNPLTWDLVESMVQSETQNETSFNEQKLAMKTYASSIDKHCSHVQDCLSLTHTDRNCAWCSWNWQVICG